MSAVERRAPIMPEALIGIGAGALLAAVAGAGIAARGPAEILGPVLLAGAPFALAALTGVAKSTTP